MKTDRLSLINNTKSLRLLSSFLAGSCNNINNIFTRQNEQAVAINVNNIPRSDRETTSNMELSLSKYKLFIIP